MNLILSEDSARAHARDDTLQEHYSAEHHFPGDLLIMVLMIYSCEAPFTVLATVPIIDLTDCCGEFPRPLVK